jgi:hypothetical protein
MTPLLGGSIAVFLTAFLFIYHIVESEENDLKWSHLISSKSADGKQYTDWNKIGQGCGVVLAFWMPFIYVMSDKMDGLGLAGVMGTALLYLGGVSSYAASVRAKNDKGVLK